MILEALAEKIDNSFVENARDVNVYITTPLCIAASESFVDHIESSPSHRSY